MTGRRSATRSTDVAQWALVGAVVGAIPAIFLVDRSWWVQIAAAVIAALVGAAAALLLVDTRRPAPPRPILTPPPARRPDSWWSEPGAPRAAAPTRPTAEEPAQLVLPSDGPGSRWWGQGTTPVDLATYRKAARVVQCPRCGAFRIDVTHTDDGYAFRCRVDDHAWTWRPGTPWPATVVASRRRTARGAGSSGDETTRIARPRVD